MLVTQAEFARMEGKAKSYITALKDAGRLVMEGDKVNVEASRSRIAETADPGHDGVSKHWAEQRSKPAAAVDPEKIGNGYQAARAIREKYNAMQAKLDYEHAVGDLVTRNAVKFKADDVAAVFRVQMETMPNVLSAQLAAMSDENEVRILLTETIENALNELSAKLGELEKTHD